MWFFRKSDVIGNLSGWLVYVGVGIKINLIKYYLILIKGECIVINLL